MRWTVGRGFYHSTTHDTKRRSTTIPEQIVAIGALLLPRKFDDAATLFSGLDSDVRSVCLSSMFKGRQIERTRVLTTWWILI